MYERLETLLNNSAEAVLRDGHLLIEMLSLYSEIFLNSKPCSTCETKHRGYYQRLAREGMKRINQIQTEKKAMEKFKLKKGVILHVRGEVFSSHNLTDKKAEQIIKEFPAMSNQFEVMPDLKKEPKPETKLPEESVPAPEEPKPAKAPVEKKPRKPRKKA